MADLWRDFWIRENGTGQQVAQLHDRYMMMIIIIIIMPTCTKTILYVVVWHEILMLGQNNISLQIWGFINAWHRNDLLIVGCLVQILLYPK